MEKVKTVSLGEINKVTGQVVDSAIKVHSLMGPGLLESVYEHCLAHELSLRNVKSERQVPIPVVYKGAELGIGFRIDLLVAESLIVELKAVEQILPIHEAQVYTYLRLTKSRVGLLLNFNVVSMKKGIKRIIL
ncbi:MAG TPA: GxxExxY protein [bacterium]|nr:GxxExxY protein [bacterium]